MKNVILGKSNILVSKVGFGVLPIGPGQLALPVKEGSEIILYAIKNGITFIDTAQYYHSYPYIREALSKLDEEEKKNIVICSKSLAVDYKSMLSAIEESKEELGRYPDIFLMHEIRPGQFDERYAAFAALVDAKKAGKIKAIGISTHHTDCAKAMKDVKEIDVVFLLYNYMAMGIRTGSSQGKVKEMKQAIMALKRAKIGVFSMKAFGGGNLTDNYMKALRFVFRNRKIDSVMLGLGSKRDVDDIVAFTEKRLPRNYKPDTSKKRIRVNHEDCEGCGVCIPRCASNAISFGYNGLAEIDQDKCITCGYCAMACPVRAIIRY